MSEDLRQGVTRAGHAVLDMVERERGAFKGLEFEAVARHAAADAMHVRSGDLESRRRMAVLAAARLILAVELIDEELAS